MRSLAVVLFITVLLTVGVAPVAGSPQSSDATCSYDETDLREYQPETAIDHLSEQPSASYGGIYSSPDRDTNVYVYFLYYTTQDGWTPVDSHELDREPVYVIVDKNTGEVQRILYSAFHYMKGDTTRSNLSMNGTHVQLHVVDPWNHYEPKATEGSFPELENYCTVVDQWQESGWQAAPEAVRNPWTMTDRASWWEEDSVRNTVAEKYQQSQQILEGTAPALHETSGFLPSG